MLPVCSATPTCSPHSQIPLHGGPQPFCSVWKDIESKYYVDDRVLLGMSNGTRPQRMSFKTQAIKSFYSNFVESNEQSISLAFINDHSFPNELVDIKCKFYNDWTSSIGAIDELHLMGGGELKPFESYNIADVEEEFVDSTDRLTENTDSFAGLVEPKTTSTINITPENLSLGPESLEMDNDSLSSAKTSLNDFLGGASEAVDSALSKVFSTFNQTGEVTGDRLTSFSTGLREAIKKTTDTSIEVLRGAVVVVEESLVKGASFVVYSYGSTKELLPPEIRDALNLSEERATKILRPIGATFQQVYIAIEGLEKSLGLDPNDPVVPLVLFLGTSATLWGFYRVWAYGGYSGDLSPQSTLKLLVGKGDTILIDVRPEVLRERDGIPDLRRAARFRYASVTLPQVDGPVRKLLRGGQDLDDTLIAAVIRNLKAVKDRYQVIVMDADGSCSKGIARSLRKLGVKRPYLVQGGFQSWAKQGLRVKELRPETALTILSEEAEAILEDIRPSPVQALGYGVGFAAASYALLEWEKTLQFIAIAGLGQTIYRRVASYNGPEDLKQDMRLLLSPVRVGAQAFSWATGKLENNRLGLPTSPSSSDVQNRVLQAAAKHGSQPSETEVQNPSPDAIK
ncbi:calcium sensing receptor [Salix suchowensis]|nr:calcium sensing receptor [Salix suchowensis]